MTLPLSCISIFRKACDLANSASEKCLSKELSYASRHVRSLVTHSSLLLTGATWVEGPAPAPGHSTFLEETDSEQSQRGVLSAGGMQKRHGSKGKDRGQVIQVRQKEAEGRRKEI